MLRSFKNNSQRLLWALSKGSQTTQNLKSIGIYHPGAIVRELRNLGFYVVTIFIEEIDGMQTLINSCKFAYLPHLNQLNDRGERLQLEVFGG